MRGMAIMLAGLALAACSKQQESEPGNNVSTAESGRAPATNQAKAGPSFDCARADGQAQELVCSDQELAAMDREVARLYRLATADPSADGGQLRAMERGWIKGRDDCWKADELRQCVIASYAERIHSLRQSSAPARNEAPEAISVGPVAFRCDGLGTVAATFVNSDPGAVTLQWGPTDSAVLPRAMAASGARYVGQVGGGEWTFWNKGREATLSRAGQPDTSCVEANEE